MTTLKTLSKRLQRQGKSYYYTTADKVPLLHTFDRASQMRAHQIVNISLANFDNYTVHTAKGVVQSAPSHADSSR
jgi:hypothetical protein